MKGAEGGSVYPRPAVQSSTGYGLGLLKQALAW